MTNSTNHQRALVVDDDETSRDFFTLVLKKHGLEVDVAQDGLAALKLMQATRYAVAVCDVRMPKLDGISVVRNMSNHANRCAVILVTASEDPALRRQAATVGVTAFLQKPVSSADLSAQLTALLPRVD